MIKRTWIYVAAITILTVLLVISLKSSESTSDNLNDTPNRQKRIEAYAYLRKNLRVLRSKVWGRCGGDGLTQLRRRQTAVEKELNLTPEDIQRIDVQLEIAQVQKPK